jgi:hypothetical protein
MKKTLVSVLFRLAFLFVMAFGSLFVLAEEPADLTGTITSITPNDACTQIVIEYEIVANDNREMPDQIKGYWSVDFGDGGIEGIADFNVGKGQFTVTTKSNLDSGEHYFTFDGFIGFSAIVGLGDFYLNCPNSASASKKYVEAPFCKVEDGRLDSGCGSTFVATFTEQRDDGCNISIYSPYGRADGATVLLVDANAAEIAAAQAQYGNAVIDSVDVVNLGRVAIYWLPDTGEFQVNAGPNAEGKVYVLNFTGCPATNIYTSNSYQENDS